MVDVSVNGGGGIPGECPVGKLWRGGGHLM